MTELQIREALETHIRCSIHKVSVPNSDIAMLVDTLFAWIKENFLSLKVCCLWCGEKFDDVNCVAEHAVTCESSPLVREILDLKGKLTNEEKTYWDMA